VLQGGAQGLDSRKNLFYQKITYRILSIGPRGIGNSRFSLANTGQLRSKDPSAAEFPFSATAMMPMTKIGITSFQKRGLGSVPAANSVVNKELCKQTPN